MPAGSESRASSPLLSSNLGIALLTRAWLFQAIIALPIAVILGVDALASVYDGYSKIYDFTMYLGNSLLAGAIIFIVLVQRQLKPETFLRTVDGRKLTFWFEMTKSVLATLLWGWILLDAIFNTDRYYRDDDQMRRIVRCIIAYIVLIFFWYSTAWYSRYSMKNHSDGVEENEAQTTVEDQGERAPLLGNETV
ncbi:hypothetical protein V8F20_000004 [Naviculisporaceae sp. PSN 640]